MCQFSSNVRETIYDYISDHFTASIFLLTVATFNFAVFNQIHVHVDYTQYDEQGDFIMRATENSLEVNAYLIPLAKFCIMVSVICITILIIAGKVPFTEYYLSNFVFSFMVRTMYTGSLMLPYISKTFLGTMTHALTMGPMYNFYILLFSLIGASYFGYLFQIWIEQPLIDLLKLTWYALKSWYKAYSQNYFRQY